MANAQDTDTGQVGLMGLLLEPAAMFLQAALWATHTARCVMPMFDVWMGGVSAMFSGSWQGEELSLLSLLTFLPCFLSQSGDSETNQAGLRVC